MTAILRFKIHRLCLILTLLLSTVGCDQLTKAIARDTLTLRSFSYLGDRFRLQHAENPGAFLSLGADMPGKARFWTFTVGVAVFVAVALWFLLKTSLNKWLTVSLTLIIAGGIGNLIDRAIKSTVTDFMNFGIGSLRTGIFNVADVAVMAGIAIMFAISLAGRRSHRLE